MTPADFEEAPRSYLQGHRRNPLTTTRLGGRLLSASQLLWFSLVPPRGYGVLTTTGRKTGKPRRKCVRAVQDGNKVYVVALRGPSTAWMRNISADPAVTVRINRRRLPGRASAMTDAERVAAKDVYAPMLTGFERLEYRMHRRGTPSPERIRELHEQWFDVGTPIVIELDG